MLSTRMLMWMVAAIALFACAPAYAGPTCADLLESSVYSCTVKSSFGSTFPDCYRFTNPGVTSTRFDMVADGLPGTTLGCACQPKGSFKKPKFDRGVEFQCTGGTAFVFGGKAQSGGSKVRKGRVTSSIGDTFVFECVRDPLCGAALQAGGSPYQR